METRLLAGDELAQWRKGKRLVRSAPGVLPHVKEAPKEIPRPDPVAPLGVRDTYLAMRDQMFRDIKANRQSYEQAKRWLRATTPGFAELSEAEIESLLDRKIRESVTRVTTDRGIMRPVVIGGANGT